MVGENQFFDWIGIQNLQIARELGEELNLLPNFKWSKDGGRQDIEWLNLLNWWNWREIRQEGSSKMMKLNDSPKVRWVKVERRWWRDWLKVSPTSKFLIEGENEIISILGESMKY